MTREDHNQAIHEFHLDGQDAERKDMPTDIRWTPDSVLGLMSDPTINYWLKDAIAELAKRDPTEACKDTELLRALMKARWDAATARWKAKGDSEMSQSKQKVARMQNSGTTVAVRWSRDMLIALENDPSVSGWLKQSIRQLAQHDPLDALYDAELLCALMKDRWEVSVGMKETDPTETENDGG